MVIFGISTAAAPVRAYWKNWLDNIDFTALEINLFKSDFPFSQSAILKNVKPSISKFDVSFHSRSNPLFGNKIFSRANQHTLLAEIEAANLLRVKQLVFHLPKIKSTSMLHNKLLKFLPKAIEFAESRNVQLLLENNSSAAFSRPEDLLFIFDNFSEIKLAMDVGHIFRAEINEKVDRFNFLDMLRKYIVYAHVHGGGTEDKHTALTHTPQTEDFFKKLKKCDIKKYIMESHTYNECIQTRELLNKYGIYESNDG